MQSFLHNYFPYADGGVAPTPDDPPRKSWAAFNSIVAQHQRDPRSPGQLPYDQARRALPSSITAVLVNDPPIRIAAATLALIATVWATPAPAAPQQARKLPPQLLSVDNPPPNTHTPHWFDRVPVWWPAQTAPREQPVSVDSPPFGLGEYQWQAAPTWTVQPSRLIAPLIPAAVVADDPPFGVRQQVSQPPPAWWPPQSAPRAQPVSVDNPPPRDGRAQTAVALLWPQPAWPSQAKKLAPSITAVPEDNPPFGAKAAAWQGPSITWSAQRAPFTPIVQAATSDDPPFGYREPHWLSVTPVWWAAQTAPREQPVSVDDPPRESLATLHAIVRQWAPVAPPVVRLQYVVQETVAASDFLPFTRQAVWRASVDWASQRRQLPASLIAVAEDNPPFGLKRQPTFAPTGWDARVSAKIAALISVAADDPPFGRRASIWTAQVSWPAQSAPRAIIPSTDDPPFGARRLRYGDALPSWAAQSRQSVAHLQGTDVPPPSEPRAFWTIIDAWRPAPLQPHVRGKLNPTALAVAVNDPPFAQRRLKEVSAYWLPPPTQWRQVQQAGTFGGAVYVGDPSGTWRAPSGRVWFVPIKATTWKAPGGRTWKVPLAARVWKARKREGWNT